MIPTDELAVIVPSAHAMTVVSRTFPALHRAVVTAGLEPRQVTVVDERPDRRTIEGLIRKHSFQRLVTGGIGNGPARNRGAASTDAPWLLFVDDDVELDRPSVSSAFRVAQRLLAGEELAAIGGLRPPGGVPAWLRWAYEDEVVTTASALAPPGRIGALKVSATFLLLHRDVFDAVDGFPERAAWGWIDPLFGLDLLRVRGSGSSVLRDTSMSGVHWYEPSWVAWLERMHRAGHRLAEVCEELPAEQAAVLLDAASLGHRPRHLLKRALSLLPRGVRRRARGRRLRRMAAASAFSEGYREATRSARS